MNPSVPTPDLNSPGPSLAASLANAPVDTQRLTELLAQEFEALKTRDIPGFEALQVERNQILHRLAFVAEWAAHQNPPPALWQDLQADLQRCKRDHFRNIQLLQRQLQAIKGALQSLRGESAASIDLYDRLGQVSRRHSASPFLDA